MVSWVVMFNFYINKKLTLINHLGISDTLITYLEIVLAEQSHMSIEEGVEEEEWNKYYSF